MKNGKDSDEILDEQIRSLRREIAELSSLLALRKLEKEHPHFHKLMEELTLAKEAMAREKGRIEDFASRHCGHGGLCKGASVLGSVLVIGSVGYAFLHALGILGARR